MDAICALHAALRRKGSSQWILDADINSCFDKIDQEMLLKKLPVFTQVIRRWLKAGTVIFDKWEPTESGTPQGSPISPLLMNVALDGMERLFGCENSRGNRVQASAKSGLDKGITIVRYADDFVATAPTKERIETYLLPKLKTFLEARGLRLNTEKTRIVHINDRFDFLGFTFVRQGGRLLTKPSKKAASIHLKRLKTHLSHNKQTPAARVVQQLNPVIRGWANYYRHGASKAVFARVAYSMFAMVWRWARRRHPTKSARWVKQRYFRYEDWAFHEKGAVLLRHYKIQVSRFIKVTGKASPMNPDEAEHWKKRRKRGREQVTYREVVRHLHRRQDYCCALCGIAFEEEDPIEKHHMRARSQGGEDRMDNLVLVHRWGHKAYHVRRSKKYKAARA
jgi:RNA-directed DNA polymerase